jgi:aldehyde dehydrogenase (NAD+)
MANWQSRWRATWTWTPSGAATNLKRTWVNHARARDWMAPEAEGRTFLAQATEVKTVWVPYGE